MKLKHSDNKDSGKVISILPRLKRKRVDQLGFWFMENPLHLHNALFSASKKGDAKKIEDLMYRGANVNVRDKNGTTPLMHSAKRGNLKAVETLTRLSANLDSMDNNEMTALDYAIDNGRIITASYLRKQGARY